MGEADFHGGEEGEHLEERPARAGHERRVRLITLAVALVVAAEHLEDAVLAAYALQHLTQLL